MVQEVQKVQRDHLTSAEIFKALEGLMKNETLACQHALLEDDLTTVKVIRRSANCIMIRTIKSTFEQMLIGEKKND